MIEASNLTKRATGRAPGFGRLLLAEWTKFRSVRSTVWTLIILVLLNIGFTTLLISFTVAQWDKTEPADREQWVSDPASTILGSGMFLSQLAICVLGAMVITTEYSTGMIKASLLAVPRRTPMPAAPGIVRGMGGRPMGKGCVMTVLDSPIPRFHLAVPVDDLAAARHFYGQVLGLEQGRSAETWVDWNLHGHQFVTHLAPARSPRIHNPVDGHDVPVPHFGLILTVPGFHELAGRLRAAGTTFVIEPYVRFEGQTGEQWTMFLLDPAGNALEFKAFADDSQVFAV